MSFLNFTRNRSFKIFVSPPIYQTCSEGNYNFGKMANQKKGQRQKVQTRRQKKSLVDKVVNAANEKTDPFHGLDVTKNYERDGLKLSVECCRGTSIDSETMTIIFQLLKSNMEDLYEKSSWGWNDEIKSEELHHENAWFLLGKGQNNELLAFSHFRFEVEGSYPVLYCYELQIDPSIQRKGVGKHFMNLLQLITANLKLSKILLTVFKHNPPALDFYMKKLGFRLDETSPADDVCYVILRKSVEK